jgi:unsaturated rhamnogalacturonyl hydrolase
MALVDLLEVLPTSHPNYAEVKAMYVGMMQTLLGLHDKATGHWYQLPARPNDTARGNYIESSATVMFGYSLAKGERLGLLKGGKWRKAAEKAWEGVKTHSLRGGEGQRITLGNVCAGTCIGERDYYYARPTTEGESFADGALLLFAYEMEK